MNIIISEYEEGTRNAIVYKTEFGKYIIVLYDNTKVINFADFLEDAEVSAEDWVMRS